MNRDIGNKIKQLRQSKGMTLKTLSEKVGLSIGFFSQLERGMTSVAVDSLYKIAEVLEVEPTYFFTSPVDKKEHVVKSYEQQISHIPNPQTIHYTLSNIMSSSQMVPKQVHLLPNPNANNENIEVYQHEGEEFIYVLEGILTMYINQEKNILYPGDCVHINSMIPHNWVNDTSKNVKFLVVNTPNYFSKEHLDTDNHH